MAGKSGVKNKKKQPKKDQEEEVDIKPNLHIIRIKSQLGPVKSGRFKRQQKLEIGRQQVEETMSGISGISSGISTAMSGISSAVSYQEEDKQQYQGQEPEISLAVSYQEEEKQQYQGQEPEISSALKSTGRNNVGNIMDDNRSNHINVMVKSQDGMEVPFFIKRTTPLKKLINEYCKHKSVTLGAYVFLTNEGKQFSAEQTPDEVGMEDGDELDAFLHQNGGGVAV